MIIDIETFTVILDKTIKALPVNSYQIPIQISKYDSESFSVNMNCCGYSLINARVVFDLNDFMKKHVKF